ncbi:MAG: type II secretion system protein GspD [Endozoicomonas sp.]
MKNQVIRLIFLVVLMAGCSSTPQKKWENRDFSLMEAIEKTRSGTVGHFKSIVEEKKKKAEASKDFDSFIDLQYWKSASMISLKKMIDEAIDNNKIDLAINLCTEALSINPDDNRVKTTLRVITNKKDPVQSIASSLSPHSHSGMVINRSSFQNSISVFNPRISGSGNRGMLDFSASTTQKSYQLYQKLKSETIAGIEPGSISRIPVYSLVESVVDSGVHIVFHPSADSVTRSNGIIRDLEGMETPLDALAKVAKKEKVNFVFFQNRVYAFRGEEIPIDLAGMREKILSFRSSYQSVDSIVTSLRAMGFGNNINNLDNKNNTVWIKGSLGEILRVLSTVSIMDSPKTQIKLSMEIVEIQHSLVTELGAKIPDFINIEFSNFTRNSQSGLNAASLTQLRTESFLDTLRAVSIDPLLSVSAKQENYEVDLIEKPILRIEDGGHAEINVGDRIPVITSTANSTGFVSERVSYIDTGVKLVVDAQMKNDGRIQLNIQVEASHMTKTVESNNGSSAPQLGTRRLNSTMVIQDGETAMLGGLSFLRHVGKTAGLPGLAQNEVIGTALGGKYSGNSTKADLMIFVTPEIIEKSMLPSRHVFHTNGTF